ncbi:hypothetical protein LR48_Vigan03g100400 [Vigna angularis]|uniref:Uncharacterized protein n=2 Tax=Phaseolus angularis TaxID=3914 RepID=A0A0L9U4M8_PHAAN|nr:hypothetical protein LR48_Vigan03g100400 [Vigna angularis]BAT84195.1 hypothetical protein VIGAN_04149000 [Vigna angularis var. angularis]
MTVSSLPFASFLSISTGPCRCALISLLDVCSVESFFQSETPLAVTACYSSQKVNESSMKIIMVSVTSSVCCFLPAQDRALSSCVLDFGAAGWSEDGGWRCVLKLGGGLRLLLEVDQAVILQGP